MNHGPSTHTYRPNLNATPTIPTLPLHDSTAERYTELIDHSDGYTLDIYIPHIRGWETVIAVRAGTLFGRGIRMFMANPAGEMLMEDGRVIYRDADGNIRTGLIRI